MTWVRRTDAPHGDGQFTVSHGATPRDVDLVRTRTLASALSVAHSVSAHSLQPGRPNCSCSWQLRDSTQYLGQAHGETTMGLFSYKAHVGASGIAMGFAT